MRGLVDREKFNHDDAERFTAALLGANVDTGLLPRALQSVTKLGDSGADQCEDAFE
jgi:hypothetical protein